MELQYFFNILLRRKWLILLTAIVAAVAAYIFVDMQKDTFKSNAKLGTGIVSTSGIEMDNIQFIQKHQIDLHLGNLMGAIKSRKFIKLISYDLLIHDLEGKEEPFITPEVDEDNPINYSPEEIQTLVAVMKQRVDTLDSNIDDPKLNLMYKKLAKAYTYDFKSLMEDYLTIEKDDPTDYLRFECESENPLLSYTVVKSLVDNYILYNNKEKTKKQREDYEFYTTLAEEKKKQLDKQTAAYNSHKQQKSIVDLSGLKSATVKQISELEIKLGEAQSEVIAAEADIRALDGYLKRESGSGGNTTDFDKINNNIAIVNLRKRINTLSDELIASNFDPDIQKNLELTQKQLENELKRLTDFPTDTKEIQKENERDSKQTRKDLLNKRIEAESRKTLATESIKSYQSKLADLRKEGDSLVSSEAFLTQKEQDVSLLAGEYKILSDKQGQALQELTKVDNQLTVVEQPEIAEKPEPSKKALISVFSGIMSGALATVLIFLLAFFDMSLNSPHQFKKFTNLDLMGTINEVKTDNLDLKYVFSSNGENKKLEVFKESLRNLRHTVENSNARTFLFTSPRSKEGKTFLIVTLTYALSLKNKKILLIDTNFKNNELTRMSEKTIKDNLLNSQLIGENNLDNQFEYKKINTIFNLENVDIIGNKGTNHSPSEVFADKDFHNFIDKLSNNYDYIFLESASLNRYSDTKELAEYADKVIAVFSSTSDIKDADKNSIDYLQGLGDKFLGAILNKMNDKYIN